MGCFCLKVKQLKYYKDASENQNFVQENISAINKITNSKYFLTYCNLKLEFTLKEKNKIQVDIVKFLYF
jgi:hypothetical protein